MDKKYYIFSLLNQACYFLLLFFMALFVEDKIINSFFILFYIIFNFFLICKITKNNIKFMNKTGLIILSGANIIIFIYSFIMMLGNTSFFAKLQMSFPIYLLLFLFFYVLFFIKHYQKTYKK